MEAVDQAVKEEAGGGGGILQQFFGGRASNSRKGRDFTHTLPVPLALLYTGGERNIGVKRRVVCRRCRNSNAGKCAGCNRCPPEVRTVRRQNRQGFTVQQQEKVASKEKCKEEQKTLTLVIEKGMGDGYELVFDRASEQTPGKIPGAVRVKLQQEAHETFTRDGDDLRASLTVSLKQALLGFRKTLRKSRRLSSCRASLMLLSCLSY
jgi:DnaJ-class molecular chaperone